MDKPPKKRRRQSPKKNEKPAPTRVLRLRSPDVGTKYTVLYDRHCEDAAILVRLKIDPTVNGAHLDPAGYDPEMAKFIGEFSTLRIDLVEAGEQLMRELDDDGADLVERLAIRKWADPHLFEDLDVAIRKWRRKRDAQRDALKQETPLDQANGDDAESDRTGVNESPPLMADPIANHKLAKLANKLDPAWVSKQIKVALETAKVARKKVKKGHGRFWSHRELRSAYPHLPDGKLKKCLESQTVVKRAQTGANGIVEDSAS